MSCPVLSCPPNAPAAEAQRKGEGEAERTRVEAQREKKVLCSSRVETKPQSAAKGACG